MTTMKRIIRLHRRFAAGAFVLSLVFLATTLVTLNDAKLNRQATIRLEQIQTQMIKNYQLDRRHQEGAVHVTWRMTVPVRGDREEKKALEYAAKVMQASNENIGD